ncbi:Zn-dependent exopeptidase [Dactylonectria macrodidyma]|uniref:Zn-dependent exopeptidase n=1 Tax=Dactylonectria macrodidyma TaxID=307937 RepID=A0A9P9I6S5_9HYPO|nr:Zn-dependent exopeptidase [Dactylonectria macrodidyma]
MARLSLSDDDKKVRDWFIETTESLSCKTTVDSIGNIFAVRPGRQQGPPILVGSHLDMQPTSGRYDGILGILTGIEMLKVLQEHNVEEGACFPISMMASGVGGDATVKSELERIGYLGETPASYKVIPIAAHFKLYIKQGLILEGAQKKIGVVQGVQANKWFTLTIKGRAYHPLLPFRHETQRSCVN